MDMVNTTGRMEVVTGESSKSARKKAKEYGRQAIETNIMKENTEMERERDMEFMFGQMASFTKVNIARI